MTKIQTVDQLHHAREVKLETEKLLKMQLPNPPPLRKPNLIRSYQAQIRKLDRAIDAYRGQD
jgi:hypothetical protein